MVAAIDAEFGTDLPDAAVFRARTVAELAIVVDAGVGRRRRRRFRIDPDLGGDRSSDLGGEEAMLFEYRMAPDDPRYNVTRATAEHSGAGPRSITVGSPRPSVTS